MPSMSEYSKPMDASIQEKLEYAGLTLDISADNQDANVDEDEDDDPFGALLLDETESPFKFTKEFDDFGMQASITEDYNDKPFRFTTALESAAQIEELDANEHLDSATIGAGDPITEEPSEKKEPDTTTNNLENLKVDSKEKGVHRSPSKKKRHETGAASPVFGSLFHQEEVEVDVPDLSQSPASLPDLTNRESDPVSDPLSDEFNLDAEDPGVGPVFKIQLDDESPRIGEQMIIDDSYSLGDGTDEEEELWQSAGRTLSLGGACISESYAPEMEMNTFSSGRRELWSISTSLSECVQPREWINSPVSDALSSNENGGEELFRHLLSVLEKSDNDKAVAQLKTLQRVMKEQLSTERVLNAERDELLKHHLDLVRRTAEAMGSMKLNLGAWVTLS